MIQIKNPCDANWQKMTPVDSGKYCSACEKVVVDFSKMNDVQIKGYFTEYATQKTCGRFLDSQLERPLVIPSVMRFNKFFIRLNKIPVARTILLFLTSTSMWISSCVKNNNDMPIGEPASTTETLIDTGESCNVPVVGFVTPVIKSLDKDDIMLIKQDLDVIKMGEVAPKETTKVLPPDFIMDDVDAESLHETDTVAVTIPAKSADSNDYTIHMIKGKVMMTDTISQKIKRKK